MSKEITAHLDGGIMNPLISIQGSEEGAGGACTQYLVRTEESILASLKFQAGDPAEGINGLSNEALLAVVADRLEGFSSGPFADNFTPRALRYTQNALKVLRDRTADRQGRGVEGKLER